MLIYGDHTAQIIFDAVIPSVTGIVTIAREQKLLLSANRLGSVKPLRWGLSSRPALLIRNISHSGEAAPTFTMDCSSLCSHISFPFDLHVHATPISCQPYYANSTISIEGGQAVAQCGSTIQPLVDICRVVLGITTSAVSEVYTEIWLPNADAWSGRTMSVDNGGLNGCVAYSQLQYVSGMGFAAIGDNGGHNSSAFDGTWMYQNNEAILDWAYRARHQSIVAGKQVVGQYYGSPANYSYYIGCSTGGAQGFHSAAYFPEDFDGIIAGSPAADFEHLQDWSSRFVQLTGADASDPRYLTLEDWETVHAAILDQCDEAIDGVPDGILEDPTLCQFNASVVACSSNNTSSKNNDDTSARCLTDTQVMTIENVFSALFTSSSSSQTLLYPAMLYGSEVDSFRLGQLAGTVQGIAHDWFTYGVHNTTASAVDPLTINATDYALADALDLLHGRVSSYAADLGAFQAGGGKLLLYHGLADPLTSAANSQRWYLKVARAMGLRAPAELDPFLRFFRISGMAHCGVGGIAGPGAWMFGQTAAARHGPGDVIADVVAWVERDRAPEVLTGIKFYYDLPRLGVEFVRPHCRFPFRTTYVGTGGGAGDGGEAGGSSADWRQAAAWNCTLIEDWRECGVGARPRLCNADGSFDAVW